MSWDGLLYLLQVYWPFLTGAGAIGLVTGWVSLAPPKTKP